MKEFIVTDVADQQFAAVLNGTRVNIRLWWNHETDYWSLSIYNGTEPLVVGRRIVTDINLLRRLNLGLGAIFARGAAKGRDAFETGALRLYQADPDEI